MTSFNDRPGSIKSSCLPAKPALASAPTPFNTLPSHPHRTCPSLKPQPPSPPPQTTQPPP